MKRLPFQAWACFEGSRVQPNVEDPVDALFAHQILSPQLYAVMDILGATHRWCRRDQFPAGRDDSPASTVGPGRVHNSFLDSPNPGHLIHFPQHLPCDADVTKDLHSEVH